MKYPRNISSEEFYKKFIIQFPEYKDRHRHYFEEIDSEIISASKKIRGHLLDVGCGDGERGYALSKKISSISVDYLDSCAEMIVGNEKIANHHILIMDISDHLPTLNKKYDIVICLNNVMGHIVDESRRIRALMNIRKLLNNNGLLFVDLNNRYNISNYGLKAVVKNILIDYLVFYKKNKGNFILPLIGSSKKYTTIVHLHTKSEMLRIAKRANLNVKKIAYYDYLTGKQKNNQFLGQLFFILTK